MPTQTVPAAFDPYPLGSDPPAPPQPAAPWACWLCDTTGADLTLAHDNALLDWLDHARTAHNIQLSSWQLLAAAGGST